MTYDQVWRPILGIHALHLPIQVHTHTPGALGSDTAAAPGEQLGFGALLKGTSVMVLRVERVLLYIHFPPPTIPARPET